MYLYLVVWHLISDGTIGEIMPWDLYKIFWAVDDGYLVTSLFGYKFSILSSPIHGVLWFIRDLMVAMLLSPIIWRIVKTLRGWSLFVFLTPWLLRIGIPVKGFGLCALCFFPLGGVFSICGENVFNYVKVIGKYVSVIFVIFLCINSYFSFSCEVPRFLPEILILAGLVSMLYIAYKRVSMMSKGNNIIKLGETSFFIYVFHTCFLFNPLRFIIDPIETLPYVGCTMAYILSFLIRVIVCVAVYYIMKRICPSLLTILVGNRLNKQNNHAVE